MRIDTKTITVDNLSDLSQVHAAACPEGTLAWVKAVPFLDPGGGLYVLVKTSGLSPNGSSRIRPIDGSPVAGSSASLWIFLVGIT